MHDKIRAKIYEAATSLATLANSGGDLGELRTIAGRLVTLIDAELFSRQKKAESQ